MNLQGDSISIQESDKIFKIFKGFLPTFKPCEISSDGSVLVVGTNTVVVSKQVLDEFFSSTAAIGMEWTIPCGVQLAGSSFPDN